MNTKSLTVAAILLVGLAATARAQTGIPGDLVIGFSATGGNGASTNLEVDLGQALNYSSAGAGTYNIANLGSDLTSSYGTWQSDSSLDFTIIGSNTSAGNNADGPKKTIWASASPYPATPYQTGPSSGNSAANGAIGGIYAGSGGSFGGSQTTNLSDINGASVTIGANTFSLLGMTTGTADVGSLAATWGATGNWNIPNSVPSQLFTSAAVGSGSASEEVFEFVGNAAAGTNTPDINALTSFFTLNSSGELTFTVVPEPSTYAAIIGIAALGYALARRRKAIA
jgi:hypothetical protein